MLVEFTTCNSCECLTCLRNFRCPKTPGLDDPCIECTGIPPYAPDDADEQTLCNYQCDEKPKAV